MNGALHVDERRIDTVLDQRRAVFNSLVNDGIELVVRHDLGDVDLQLVPSHNVVIVTALWSAGVLGAGVSRGRSACSYRRSALLFEIVLIFWMGLHIPGRLEWRVWIARKIDYRAIVFGVVRSFGQGRIQVGDRN